MPKQDDTPKQVIDSYRKRRGDQGQNWQTILIFIVATLLLIAGTGFLVFWLTGTEFSIGTIFPSDTPTPTSTPTPTPVTPTATPSPTATIVVPTDTPTVTLTPTRSSAVIYVAQEGDSLYAIAEQFEVDLFTLIVVNRDREDFALDPVNPFIRVGDEILIPAPGEEIPPATPIPLDAPAGMLVAYTVRPGDSVQSVALNLRSTPEDIFARNEFIEEDQEGLLFVGQIINVRVNLVTAVPTEEGQDEGETPQNTPGSISTLTPTPSP
ncbi:MAG: hypothetical protein MAG431_01450 [Chloroflexi bacterium]|nr:hypothetical protein [Chloroflexota bacterium]